jgi:adenylate kinase
MDIVLFGIQGSGKGTQARKLAEEFGYRLFEAGGALRAIAAEESHLGSQVRSYINAGHLVPHEIIMEVVRSAVIDVPAEAPVLFDGIPRDAKQQADFDALMTEYNRPFQCINIALSADEAMARIRQRAATEGRVDDSDDVKIHRRFQIFQEETTPVIESYRARTLVTDVDGRGSVDEVYQRLKAVLPH